MSKRRAGRPEHAPDSKSRNAVAELVKAGVDQETIAKSLGISKPTLRKHYAAEIDTSTGLMIGKLAGALYKRALKMEDGPAVTAAIFILKTRGGWSEARPVAPAPATVPVDAVDVWGGEEGA